MVRSTINIGQLQAVLLWILYLYYMHTVWVTVLSKEWQTGQTPKIRTLTPGAPEEQASVINTQAGSEATET